MRRADWSCIAPATVTPKWNTLAFFEVSRFSFHQVEQVYSEAVPRYSITCWFHDRSDEDTVIVTDLQSPLKPSFEMIQPIKFVFALFPVESLINDIETLSLPSIAPTSTDISFLLLK